MIFKSFVKLICGFAIVIVSFSCVEEKNSTIADPLYFNLNGFIESLVLTMDTAHYSLNKEFTIGGNEESKSYTRVNWKKELEHFKECDINSPVLRETFNVKTLKLKGGSKTVYTPKNIKDNRIKLLSIVYDSNKNIKRISGKIVSSNILYSSERILSLTLSQINNKTTIQSFSIKNKEGLIFSKPSLNQLKAAVISSF